jgi:hypothetical protein
MSWWDRFNQERLFFLSYCLTSALPTSLTCYPL